MDSWSLSGALITLPKTLTRSFDTRLLTPFVPYLYPFFVGADLSFDNDLLGVGKSNGLDFHNIKLQLGSGSAGIAKAL